MAERRTPWHLWVVAALALLWASMPTYDWVMFKLGDPAYLAGLPTDWRNLILGQPWWVEAAWFLAIWAAVAGGLFLFARRRLAWPVLATAFVALTVDQAYVVFLTSFGFAPQIPVILAVSALFALYAWWMAKRGVLR